MTPWIVLALVVTGLWILDLTAVKPHKIELREAVVQSAFWVSVSALFGMGVWALLGAQSGSEWFMAYITEKSLSVDNLLVFIAIFSFFRIPDKWQHEVLYWGILVAVLLRGVCIFGGVTLLASMHWLTYVFGAVLLWTSRKVLADSDSSEDFDNGPVALWLRKYWRFDMSERSVDTGKFLVKSLVDERVVTYGTRLLFALWILETTDLLFATDSLPAALGCSHSAFIVFSSNIFAVLGLRSLYFCVSGLIDRLQYLKYGVSAVLVLISLKMLLSDIVTVPTIWWLSGVALVLGSSIVLSQVKHDAS